AACSRRSSARRSSRCSIRAASSLPATSRSTAATQSASSRSTGSRSTSSMRRHMTPSNGRPPGRPAASRIGSAPSRSYPSTPSRWSSSAFRTSTRTRRSYAARSRTWPPSPGSIRTARSGRLAGHRPYGDDVDPEQDNGERERRPEQGAPLALAKPAHADAAHDQGDEKDETPGVGEDEPDTEPLRGWTARGGRPALGAYPPARGPHEAPAGRGAREQRPVAEPQESRVTARQGEAGGRREDAADEDHRPEHVQEERE